ncbi:MAG: peptidyl-prolyl cis-trans isomerase, partial [Pseudomonadota bacterium]
APDAATLDAPDETTLTAYFTANQSRFRAPEYRSLSILVLDPGAFASTIEIDDATIEDAYEASANRYRTEERRTVRQIPFADEAAAAAAAERLASGTTFDDLVAEMNLTAVDTDLGTLEKSGLLDQAVADAAFALEEGEVSGAVKGSFRTFIISVPEVFPGEVQSLDSVKETLRAELQLREAENQVLDLFDLVEDDRAAGLTLQESAEQRGLQFVEISAIDRQGRDMDNNPVATLPASADLLREAFQAEVGLENDPLQYGQNGNLWYDVTDIVEARDRTLDEVRDDVIAAWRADQVQTQLSERAEDLRQALADGKTLDAIAAEDGLILTSSAPLNRTGTAGDLGREAVDAMFSLPAGEPLDAPHANGNDRLVMIVTDRVVPPLTDGDTDSEQLATQLADGVAEDLIAQYIDVRRAEFGATINQRALDVALGLAPAAGHSGM